MSTGGDDTAATLPEAAARGRRRGGTLPPGTQVGRYVVHQEIARGGMGVVYQAHDPELERRVALKLVRVRARRDLQARDRLLREAQALAQLSHPNVITIHDVGTHGGDVFVAMELVDGESLRTWMRTRRPWLETMQVLLAAGRGLAAAHAGGLVHRDFKPDNVMVGHEGQVRVLDFGLARPALVSTGGDGDLDSSGGDGDSGEEVDDEADTRSIEPSPAPTPGSHGRLGSPLTAVGRIVGTPRYMSPEQHRGGGLDALSDQFSFCVTAWEALYRTRPFGGASSQALRDAKEAGRIEPTPADVRVPARIRRILLRGMARLPAERFPSMDALIGALGRAVELPRRVAMAGAAAGAGLLAVAAALTIGLRGGAAEPCQGAGDQVAAVWGTSRPWR